MDEIKNTGQIDLRQAIAGDRFVDVNGKELTYVERGDYLDKNCGIAYGFILRDCRGKRYVYTYDGHIPDDMYYCMSDHCSLQKKIDIDNPEQKVVEEGSTKAERVEIRLKIALKLVDDVDNRNMRERLKKQIDKIEAAIMDF